MKKIDTSEWKFFRIGDLFEVKKGTRLTKANMKPGEIRFIGSSAMHNGLTAMISNNENIHPANTLTVCYNGSVGETFYQDRPFWASDDVNVLYPKFEMNMFIGMFMAPIIKSVSTRYNFIDKWKQEVMIASNIKLPATSDGKPDYNFMCTFMQDIMKESEANLEKLMEANKSKHTVNMYEWKSFCLGELFDIVKGTRLTKSNQQDGHINFISASSFNNGISATISNDEHIHPGNTLTVSYNGSDIGRTFYQEAPFWASDDVNVLYPKFPLTKNIALFIAPIIKAIGGNHVYKNKWLQDDMKTAEIMLPVTTNGTPNWEYMNTYTGMLLNSASLNIDALTKAIG